ncbi:MAG: hypothetical protein J6Q78_02605 [Clostridia bacterium]|nr:hypothetical protein [Clostridia bacterium]
MRKFFRNLKNKAENAVEAVKSTVASKSAEGYVDTGVKIIIAVVIGGVILAGLYTLFNGTIIPNLQNEIVSMFGYAG